MQHPPNDKPERTMNREVEWLMIGEVIGEHARPPAWELVLCFHLHSTVRANICSPRRRLMA